MKPYSALGLVAFVAGCASATGPVYEEPPSPPEGYAEVIVYRVPALASGAHSLPLQIDGTPVAKLDMKGYTRVLLRPGVHSFNQLRGAKVAAGSIYYFRCEAGTAFPTIIPGTSGEFTLVPAETAKQEIAGYHFQPPQIDKQDWNTSE